ncbi:MAG TPA: chitobiase/beta-hexosaminidase C-terminal domain-containing protein, partial [Rectinemataceae bacterium]|nr:chitobiase/beta-hexosaminidase C-terminal domain-containing protein [Rectinemataceae bacterium]
MFAALILYSCTGPNQWIEDLWKHYSNHGPTSATPVMNPASGIYRSAGLSVTIEGSDPGSTIYYTVNGSAPTPTSSSGPSPFTLNLPDLSTSHVQAIAESFGHAASGVASATYCVDPVLSICAGGGASLASEGLGSSALSLGSPAGIFLAPSGDLYVADHDNAVVIRISNSTVHLVAGVISTPGSSPDGTPAVAALLNGPSGVAVNAAGDVYISESNADLVRVVRHSSGRIYTIAGGGTDTLANGVPALTASL